MASTGRLRARYFSCDADFPVLIPRTSRTPSGAKGSHCPTWRLLSHVDCFWVAGVPLGAEQSNEACKGKHVAGGDQAR